MGQIKSRLQNLLPPKPPTTGSEVVYYRHQDCNFNVKLFNTTELIAFDQKERCVSSRLFRLYVLFMKFPCALVNALARKEKGTVH